MQPNNSSVKLVIGLAAFGLALVAGLGLRRRSRMGSAPGEPDREKEIEPGAGDDPVSGAGRQDLPSGVSQEDRPLKFFLLVFVLSIPFWLFGGNKLPVPIDLPISALAAFTPVIAASILTYRRSGSGGLRALFKKALDYKKIQNKIWYLPILFLLPLIYLLAYLVMRLAGLPLPDDPHIPWLLAPVLFIALFIFAAGEELGWMGYAVDPLQNRWGALKAGLILGVVWGIWHVIPHLQQSQSVDWILWHRLSSVAVRVLIVWIYNNTGKSVMAAILVHAMDNLSVFLFPNFGSYYNPFVNGLITWLITGIVILVWGPRMLRSYRFA